MDPESNILALANLVKPERLVSYADATGWVRVSSRRQDVAVFNAPPKTPGYEQLIVPLDAQLDDYGDRIGDAALRIGRLENRSVGRVLSDLAAPPADVLRFRLDDPQTADGSVPFLDGLELLRGAERSLRAAGCAAIEPMPFYRRLARAETDLLVQNCKLGQTERGSFVVLVICPLEAVPSEPDPRQYEMFPEVAREPFARQATRQLMRAVDRVKVALSANDPTQITRPGPNELVVSANLCEALMEMQPPSVAARLWITASFAKTVPLSMPTPEIVEIPGDMFPAIGRVAASLRPSEPPEETRFVGTVRALMGQKNKEGRMEGEVVVLFQLEDELLRAKVYLSADDYQIACDAHKQASYVSLNGTLVRHARLHQIDGYSAFRHLVGG